MADASLRYFTGTGNSWRVLDISRKILEDRGYSVTNNSITGNAGGLDKGISIAGFCFPVYGLGLPRIAVKYLELLPPPLNHVRVFLIVDGACENEHGNCGWSLTHGEKILREKGYDVTFSDLVTMPDNYLPFSDVPSPEEALLILNNAEKKVLDIINSFLDGKEYHKPVNLEVFGEIWSRIAYAAFHGPGLRRGWKLFNATGACTACGICEKFCPVRAVRLVNGRPRWSNACEQCMRCINYCPEEAIRQLWLGKYKYRYHEPHFKPLESSAIRNPEEL